MDSLENGEILKRAMNEEINATFQPSARSSYPRLVRLVVTFASPHPISNSLTGGRGFAVTSPEPARCFRLELARSVSLG